MTKFEKLMESIRTNPKDVSFEELEKVMRRHGFTYRQPGSGSSHYTFYHTKYTDLKQSVPYHRPIKAVYVKACLDRIDEALLRESMEED